MKISIITVCYNSELTIRDCIETVLEQDYPDIEYIIVDGGSSDETMNIVREYEGRIDTVISEPDQGIYDAMNKGIGLATGEFVGTLNSDDLFAARTVISSLAALLNASPQLDGAYADLEFVRRNDVDQVFRVYSSKRFSKTLLRFGIVFPHPTFYVKRALFDELGYYKLNYRVSADFELLTRFIIRGVKLGRLSEVMVKMREGGISTTGIWGRIHQNMEIVRACRENGIYTNILLVALKIPVKLAGYIFR